MTKLSELSAASTLTGAEIVPVTQSGTTVRTTVTNILAAAPATPAVVSDDLLKVSNSGLGLDATLRALVDGNGVEGPFQVSTSAVMLPDGAVFPYGNSTKFTDGKAGIIIPFYVYPNNPYTDPVVARLLGLIRQYREVPVIVVINPDSGPGLVWDGNWAALITVLKAAGACVAGYVSTVYATRPSGEVFADVNGWLALYGDTPISTIFFDEQPYDVTVGLIDTVALYKSYTDYCHARNLFPTIGNPGTNQRGEHFATRTADLIIVHENSTWPSESDMLGNYVGGHVDYPYTLRAALCYGQSALVPGLVRQLAKYVQYIYVTDDVLPSPWDSLPPYLEQLFAIVSGREELSVLDFGAVGDGTTDDTTAWTTALLEAAGKTLIVPAGTYLIPTGNLTATTNTTVRGEGFPIVKVGTTTLNALFAVTGSNVTIEGLDLLGNNDTQTSVSSASTAINVSAGLENVRIRGNKIRKWTRHGIVVGGVTSAFITQNYVNDIYYGAGIYSGQGAAATNVSIIGNTVIDTQWANIQLGDHDGLVVEGNICDSSGSGSGAMGTGAVADNITCYPYGLTLKNAVFNGNTCKNSGNHGMHLGGPSIVVSNNVIYNATQIGLLISAGGTTENPNQDLERVVVTGNTIRTSDRTNVNHKGISIRNVSNFVVTGNTVRDAYDGIEIRFIDETTPTLKFTQAGAVVGNSFYGIQRYGCELNSFVRNCGIFCNVFDVVDAGGEHIRFNTDASITKAQNPAGNNVYAGVGSTPRSWQMLAGDSTDVPALQLVAAATNAPGAVLAKGNSPVYLGTENGYGAEVTAPTALTVNRVGLRGNPTGSSPVISATGSDTNLDLQLSPKGTGVLRFGTLTANADAAITGYISVKDSGGTTRKLAVIT